MGITFMFRPILENIWPDHKRPIIRQLVAVGDRPVAATSPPADRRVDRAPLATARCGAGQSPAAALRTSLGGQLAVALGRAAVVAVGRRSQGGRVGCRGTRLRCVWWERSRLRRFSQLQLHPVIYQVGGIHQVRSWLMSVRSRSVYAHIWLVGTSATHGQPT